MHPIATLNHEGQKLVDKYLGFLVAQRQHWDMFSTECQKVPVRLSLSCPSIQPPINVPVLGFPPLPVLLTCSITLLTVITSQLKDVFLISCLWVCCRENLNWGIPLSSSHSKKTPQNKQKTVLCIYFSPSIFVWTMKWWLLLGSCVSPQPSYPNIHVRCFQFEDPIAEVRPQEYLVCSEFHLQPNKIQVLLTWAQLLDCVWQLVWMGQQPCVMEPSRACTRQDALFIFITTNFWHLRQRRWGTQRRTQPLWDFQVSFLLSTNENT